MVASMGEQPGPGEEKIIRSQRHDHKITEIFTFATGSKNNGDMGKKAKNWSK